MARLLSTLPVGAKVVETGTKYNDKPITWLVGGHNHYAQGQTALVSEKIITLKPFDAREYNNTDNRRKDAGNNRYSVSNIRQWLNSDKASWYSPQHSTDAPPNNANVWSAVNDYDTEAGFLTNFSTGMRSALITTALTTAKNTVTDGGGSEVVNDKVFLLSNTEVGLENENSIAEGKLLPLFSNDASRIAYPTVEAVTKSEYREADLDSSKPCYYWLRSPHANYSEVARGVYTSGGLYSKYAYAGDIGARPALNLSSNVVVSDTPNSNGEYELILSNLETKLLRDLPVGAKVVDKGTKYNGKPVTWLVGGHNHYSSNQTALVSEKVISLKPFDAKEPNNTDSDRENYGNNRYSVSNIRQWLNSSSTSWYSAQHGADAPPNNENIVSKENDYDTEAGFLTNFSIGMRSALVAPSLITAKNTVTDVGGSEVVNDKVFLLSKTEVGLSNVNNIAEGKLLAMFSGNASRIAYPTAEAVAISEYKDTALDSSKPWEYWLRSPVPYTSYSAYGVTSSSGAVLTATYNGSLGIRPAINLSSDILVLGTPNSNGEYELILPDTKSKLLSDLPVGTRVVSKGAKYNDKPITWLVGSHNHYAQGQTALVSEKIITLKPFDAKEASNADDSRKNYGNNRYSVSNIRQWLNSDKASWYSPQHSTDAPPNNASVINLNSYDAEAGFLTNFSTGMKNSLVTPSLITAKNTVTDGGGSEVVSDKVFLLSNTEVGLANENNTAEGKLLPLFSNGASRVAYPTTEAVTKSEYKDANLVASKPWYYWLRSPYASTSHHARYVTMNGVLTYDVSNKGSSGIRPAINVMSTTSVSASPGADGSYEIIAVSISPANGTNLGGVSTPNEVLRYTVVADSEGITVTEKFNGVPIDTKTVSNEGSYTVTIPSSLWDTTKYGAFRDNSGSMNVVSLEVSTGQVYTYPISKVLPPDVKTEEVVKAVNDMSNIAMPSHKKKLVDAIGNKATVGGKGTLGDIAKAIESINLQSLGGVPISVQSISRGSATKMFPDPNGATSAEKFIAINTSALPFIPTTIVVRSTSNNGSPTLWMRNGINDVTSNVTTSLNRYSYKVPYDSSIMYLPVSASIENTQVYQVYIYGG